MLLAFRVANFRSIRDEQELSMARPRRLEHTLDASPEWDAQVTPVAALYGANASGKSNVLRALNFMVRAVEQSYTRWTPTSPIPVDAFALSASHRNHPSRFELEFTLDEVRFQYGFELTQSRVEQEWLYAYPASRRQTLLERDASTDEEWYFGKALSGRNRSIAALTRPTALFLSTAASSGHDQLLPVYKWITSRVAFADSNNADARTRYTLKKVEQNAWMASRIRVLLGAADLGICDVRVRHHDVTEDIRHRFLQIAQALDPELEAPNPDSDAVTRAIDEALAQIELLHTCAGDDEPVALPFESESLGTRTLVSLAGPAFHALDQGSVLLVDEIDTSLHPQLVAEFVGMFQRPESNPRQAQLIFSSHDASLLGSLAGDGPVLARDQVWLVEKDATGATQLFALTDFHPRRLENLERGYLQGRYGAVPVMDPRAIAEAAANHGPAERE